MNIPFFRPACKKHSWFLAQRFACMNSDTYKVYAYRKIYKCVNCQETYTQIERVREE